MSTKQQTITNGFHYLMRGFVLLKHPKLRFYVATPLAINILTFSLLIALCIHQFNRFITWVDSILPNWLAWLNWLLWFIFILAAVLVIFYTFLLLASIISAPFNSLLSEKVEMLLRGKTVTQPTSFANLMKDIPRSIGRQIKILLYYLPRALGLLILFFIPIIQLGASFFWFAFNAWIMTMQYIDYPMDNNQVPFSQLLTNLRQKRVLSLSFGSAILLSSLIPIVNFFVIPAATIGATVLWIEEFQNEL